MFRTLIYHSSGACDYAVELPHWSFCSCFAEACNTGTTQTQPHQISNTQRNKNKTTNVVIQQHCPKLLMMDILVLMSETCWVHKKKNKIASDKVGILFFSYHNDARSNKHQIPFQVPVAINTHSINTKKLDMLKVRTSAQNIHSNIHLVRTSVLFRKH